MHASRWMLDGANGHEVTVSGALAVIECLTLTNPSP